MKKEKIIWKEDTPVQENTSAHNSGSWDSVDVVL